MTVMPTFVRLNIIFRSPYVRITNLRCQHILRTYYNRTVPIYYSQPLVSTIITCVCKPYEFNLFACCTANHTAYAGQSDNVYFLTRVTKQVLLTYLGTPPIVPCLSSYHLQPDKWYMIVLRVTSKNIVTQDSNG